MHPPKTASPSTAPHANRPSPVRNAAAEDRVFAAMASRVRRRILDLLRDKHMTTGQLAAKFPALSRFAVMQHLGVLAKAKLVVVRKQGRERHHYLNIVPLHAALDRWVRVEEHDWARTLSSLKRDAESTKGEAT